MDAKRRDLTISIIPILLLAYALRIWGLADHSIWWDEGIGVWLSRMPVLEAIRWTAGDVHPPLYYIVLRGWHLVAGKGEFVLRYPSVLFSFLTVAVVFRLGKTLGGVQAGLLAALFLAPSRFAIWWAQEIRMYALAALCAAGSLWSAAWLWRDASRRNASERNASERNASERNASERKHWRPWILYGITTLSSFYTLYLTVTVGLVTNLGALFAWWRGGRKRRFAVLWLSAQVAVAALTLPWLLYALPRMHSWSSDAPFTPSFFAQLYATILAVGSPLDLQSYSAATAAAFVALVVGLIALLTRRTNSVQQASLVMLLAGLLLPPLVVLLISLPGLRFYFSRPLVPRYLLPLAACYTTLMAWGVRTLARKKRWMALIAAGTTLVVAFTGLLTFYPGRIRRDDYVTIAEALAALRQPGDAVVLYVDRDWPIFTAHYAGDRQDLAYGADYGDGAALDRRLRPIWDDASAVWLVSTPESLQADPGRHVPAWLAAHAAYTETLVTGEASLTLYARTLARAQEAAAVVAGFTPPFQSPAHTDLIGASIPLARYKTGDTVHLGLYWEHTAPTDLRITFRNGTTEITFADMNSRSAPGVGRSQIDLALTPDLPGGRYRVIAEPANGPPLVIGGFTLVHTAAGAVPAVGQIPNPTDYHFGENITLVGYALPNTTIFAGQAIPLTLYWQTDAPVAARYKVFTHVVGTTFNARTETFLWGQQDNEPVNGQAPTTLWAPGAIIADDYLVAVEPDAPPGVYTLEIGLYGLTDGLRLPASGAGDRIANDAVLLATVTVAAKP